MAEPNPPALRIPLQNLNQDLALPQSQGCEGGGGSKAHVRGGIYT